MDRRERERREASQNKSIKCKEEVDFSYYIGWVDDLTKEEMQREHIFLYRSSRGSKKKLFKEMSIVEQVLKKIGVSLKRDVNGDPCIYGEIASGKISKLHQRSSLKRAIEESEDGKYPILVYSPSRLLRNEDYHPIFNKGVKPTRDEYEEFLDRTNSRGVEFISISNPNASVEEDEAFLTSIGGRFVRSKKQKRAGYCKKRRMKWKEESSRLLNIGYTTRQVADEISSKSGYKIDQSTIVRWSKIRSKEIVEVC